VVWVYRNEKNIIYIIYYAEGAREDAAAAATSVAAAERVSIFDKSKSHYHMYARVYIRVPQAVQKIYTYILYEATGEGGACRTTVFGQHTTLRHYIYIIILYKKQCVNAPRIYTHKYIYVIYLYMYLNICIFIILQ